MEPSVEKIWTTEAGFLAASVWNARMGFRCGYVAVPESHPLYKIGYGDESPALGTLKDLALMIFPKDDDSLVTPELYFDVHGGIIFADNHCPTIDDGPEDLWWFGFNCGHVGDGPVRSLEYVMEECESLARQLAEVQSCQN